MFQTVPVCMSGVADKSLVRQPATTCSWLQRLIPVLLCVARAATTPHILTWWPLQAFSAGSVTLKVYGYTLLFSRNDDQLRNSETCVAITTAHTANTPSYTAHK
jgi:hypothetical protein